MRAPPNQRSDNHRYADIGDSATSQVTMVQYPWCHNFVITRETNSGTVCAVFRHVEKPRNNTLKEYARLAPYSFLLDECVL